MTQILRLLQKFLRSGIAINIALSLLLLMPTVVLAGDNNSGDSPPNTSGISGGSRMHQKNVFSN